MLEYLIRNFNDHLQKSSTHTPLSQCWASSWRDPETRPRDQSRRLIGHHRGGILTPLSNRGTRGKHRVNVAASIGWPQLGPPTFLINLLRRPMSPVSLGFEAS